MRITLEDRKHETVQVIVDNIDDLWVLYNVIKRNDVVFSRTTREVKSEGVGRPSSKRVPATLGLKVEKVYYDKDLVRLRIHGVVVDAPEDLEILGAHHTISLSESGSVKIIKESWAQHDIDSLKKASATENPVIIVALDNDECTIGVSRISGVEIKIEIKSKLPGKREAEKREQAIIKYFSEISDAIGRVMESSRGRIVVVGPGFAKENFARYLKNNSPDLAKDVAAVKSVSSSGSAGVYEAIRVGVIGKVLRDARSMNELALVEELLARLGASTGNVSYGIDEVWEDSISGAVEVVLVCDETLRGVEATERQKLEEALRIVDAKGGRVVVISTGHEGGRKLESLGGLAALLRYGKHRDSQSSEQQSL